MTLKLADRVFETTITTGTGTVSLAGPVTGFQSFVSGIGSGNKTFYQIDNGTQWEEGIGTVTAGSPDTLTRSYVTASSNAGAAVNFGAGTKNVRLSFQAKGQPSRDENLCFTEGFGAVTFAANVYTLTPLIAPLAYSDGAEFSGYIPAGGTNTATGCTIVIGTLGAVAIKIKGNDPAIGDLAAGLYLQGRYKASTNTFELASPIPTPVITQNVTYFAPKVLSGLITSPNATNPTTQIDIATGYGSNSAGLIVQSSTALTKTINVAWVAGTGGGNFNGTTVPANLQLALWMIRNTTSGAVDFGYDTLANGSANTVTPAGWTKVCRIGYIPTGASGVILPYKQTGDYFELKTPLTATATSTTSRVLTTLQTPPLVDTIVRIQGSSTAAWILLLQNTYETDVAPGANVSLGAAANTTAAGDFTMKPDASLQIASRANVNVSVSFNVRGWYDRRGKED